MRCVVFYDYEDGSFHEVQNLRWIFCKGGVKKGNPLLLVGDWVFGWRGCYLKSLAKFLFSSITVNSFRADINSSSFSLGGSGRLLFPESAPMFT